MPYLDEFVKSVASLHSELRDKYGEMGNLDVNFQERQKQLRDLYEQELEDAKKGLEPGNAQQALQFSSQVSDLSEICKAIAEQKIQMATEIYKKVDGHIRRLDKHLRKFDQEMKSENKIVSPTIFDPTIELHDKVCNIGETGANDKKLEVVEPPVTMELDLPVDPNEPTYCICNRVSFGEMVACDNDSCKIEWFRYECVGITDRPKGKWYCPECAPSMKHRKKG